MKRNGSSSAGPTVERVRLKLADLERALARLPIMVWIDNRAGACIFVNRAWQVFTGRRADQAFGRRWLETVHPDDRDALMERYEAARRRQRAIGAEFRVRRADGEYRLVRASGAPNLGAHQAFLGYVGTCVDVTGEHDRERLLERERDEHAALMEALIASLQDGVMAETEEGQVTVVNNAYCRIFGLGDPSAVIGGSAHILREELWSNLDGDVDAFRKMTRDLRRDRAAQLSREITLKNGRVLDRDYIPVSGPAGTVHMWHYRDVTDRRRLERRLRESSRRLRELSTRLEHAREQERGDLARMLHDEMGQLMSSIRLELVGAISLFRESADDTMRPVVDRLQAAAGLTDVAMQTLRTLTSQLRPPILDQLGLVAALRWQATVFSKRTGIRCEVRSRPADLAFDAAQTTALYRIALEALENIYRHSGAGTAWVHFTHRAGVTMMEVRDNGRGISQEQIENPRTMGLLGMRERALAIGGDVRVSSASRRGTRVLVILPGGGRE